MYKVLVFGATCVALAVADGNIVETSYGKVQGTEGTSRDGRTFHAFKGIPYAKAERFQPPTAPDSWTDVKDATKFGNVCPQVKVDIPEGTNPKVIGDEHCHFVNVFTPKLPKDGEHKIMLPVVVFFAGGMMHGFPTAFGPEYFMDEDVVLVTFSSRLGALGFLNLDHEGAAGNQGLKDQVMLLKWVQDNIEKFGGDKARVTIAGSGQGGAMVHYHLLSPKSKDLFQNAISTSGSALAPWAFVPNPIYQAKLLAKKIDCPDKTKEELLECLKTKKAEDLVPLISASDIKEFKDKEFVHFGPSVERVNTDHAFLDQSPHTLMEAGKVNKVPWAVGVNDQDGANPLTMRAVSDPKTLEAVNEKFDKILPRLVLFDHIAKDPDAVAKKVKEFYFEGKPIDKETRLRFMDLIADRMFFAPCLRAANIHTKYAPTFTFIVEKKAAQSMFDIFGMDIKPGSAFLDDLHYMFPMKAFKFDEITKDSPDYEFSKHIVQLVASLSEVNKPAKIWPDAKSWEPYDPTKTPITLMSLNDKTKDYIVEGDMLKRHGFWANLYNHELKAEEEDPPKEEF